ncbi:MAG: feruloyl-CoA synthase, partial [Alphaproteobacteria bacterium]|nr:feruloyl-CoA synthase [Alphaproteobacteria bacterium]
RLAQCDADASGETIVAHPAVRAAFQERFDALAQTATGSASHIARAIIMAAPPALDAGEITDKGSINQRAVLAARPGLHADLYAASAPDHVLSFARKTEK